MLEAVKAKLASLGYAATAADDYLLGFIITKVETHIKSQCNTLTVPEGLNENAVDMVCGEFLLIKKNSGQLTGFNLDAAVKSIQEGDTTITFAFGSGDMTPEGRFEAMIGFLMREADFASYRRVKW